LQSAKFDKFPIDYTKKFSEIAPQLERELIPRIQTILIQREFQVTLKLIRDILSDYHKNGQRKWKDEQLNDDQKKQKKYIGHITNRLSEVILTFLKILLKISNNVSYLIIEMRTKIKRSFVHGR